MAKKKRQKRLNGKMLKLNDSFNENNKRENEKKFVNVKKA